ncbi:hypothetical protein [Lysinibacter sp. HNR]|uniref:hypothetical protein n=1 Tax=Lysinibacter sp. HNR TaxID=3031408 RepID=UPI002435BE42|nr:hypothetical protein [Lysinibacter sp. HNR]WGD38539.1 hypothetical protein FrondiHNR_06440 [Lysinibacter sp. HNR]
MLIIGLAGLAIGVLVASSRVPRMRWIEFFSTLALLVPVIWLMVQMGYNSFFETLTLVVTVLLASALYAGLLWKRENIDPSVTYWKWVWMECVNSRYVRSMYRESRRIDSFQVTPHS